MEIFYWPKFAKYLKKLPIEIQKIAVEKEKIFKKDPFKFIDKNTAGFYLIGDHDIYE